MSEASSRGAAATHSSRRPPRVTPLLKKKKKKPRTSPHKCLSSGSCLISPRCRIADVSAQQPLHFNKQAGSLMTSEPMAALSGCNARAGPRAAWKPGANSTIRPQPLPPQTVNSDVATCQKPRARSPMFGADRKRCANAKGCQTYQRESS